MLRDGQKGGAWLTEGAGPDEEGSGVLLRVRGGTWGEKGDEGRLRGGEGRGWTLVERKAGADSEKKEWGVLASESSGLTLTK